MIPIENIFEEESDLEEETSEDDEMDNERFVNERECVVCKEEIANVVLMPCKHLKICSLCKIKLSTNTNRFNCPYCRRIVEECMDVFI
ncbi:putative E3 ubiquitin-protein ligase MGRN1 [Lucilia cuprina]|nr:putative E3 ubiquitin-protein ligase MGRN1 [Lucilia cuprina]